MSRYRITESVGNRVETVNSFRDLEKHHPSSGREPGRDYEVIDGELEEVRRTNDGRTLIKKDFILAQDGGGSVNIPAPVAGYIHYLNDATNAVRIYDRPHGEPGARLLAQSLHMERGTSPPQGSRIEYGQPMGRMGDTGSPGSVHAHVEAEHAQFQRYIRDIDSGVIAPGVFPSRSDAAAAAVPPGPMADGVLRESERGTEVRSLQQRLNSLGYGDAQGRILTVDGDFGSSTRQSVEAFQRAQGLGVDGVVGRDTFAALGRAAAEARATPAAEGTTSQYGATPLSNLIGSGEGGYNSYNRGVAGDSVNGRTLALTDMTVGEIMRRQDLPRSDPDRLFAVGKFQIIPGTMEETVRALGVDRNARYTPELQERMFADYLVDEKRPAVHGYITGRTGGAEGLGRAQLALAQEFASVADPRTGRSYYDGDSAGNSASITAAQAAGALGQMRRAYQANIDQGMAPGEAYRAIGGRAPGEGRSEIPGSTSQARADAPAVLREGDRGEAVTRLQQQLNLLGQRDRDGRALETDGAFGPRSRDAVEAFQRTQGLAVDGIVGAQTNTALRDVLARQQSMQPGSHPSLSDTCHPDHAMFNQALSGLGQLDPSRTGLRDGDAVRNAAAALVVDARTRGMDRIDQVALGSGGRDLFAVQGQLEDPAHLRIKVDKTQAAAQPIERSSELLAQAADAQQPRQQREQEERQQTMMA